VGYLDINDRSRNSARILGMTTYDWNAIEARWQAHWEAHETFRARNPGAPGFDANRPKLYVLDMFPYPSGVGLHVGHPLGYIATDVLARYKRMRGYNVLHPMGFDAFGLPAEQFAVEHGVHPRVTTEQNIATMTRQLKRLGLSYDWRRCLATTDPGYYRWTQWIFLELYQSYFDAEEGRARPIEVLIRRLEAGELMVGVGNELVSVAGSGAMATLGGAPVGARHWYELDPAERQDVLAAHRLAYLADAMVNWCPALGTVLANEEVTSDGRSDRGNHLVYRRPLRQWMLRITAYADRLADELALVDWPEPIKIMQRNWIGRSEGATIAFPVEGRDASIEVFTTRPDTLFGATYMVLSPEHPLADEIIGAECRAAVADYRDRATRRLDAARAAQAKTGVFTGAWAINPATGERIPIWIADYVLMGYGTGAIMAVPAHDQRDFEFAMAFELPMRAVVMPDDPWLAQRAADARSQSDAAVAERIESLRRRYREAPVAFGEAFEGEGVAINSAGAGVSIDGFATADAKRAIIGWLSGAGVGRGQVQYKLRDWLFSRQRYWGEPFPILHGPAGEIRPVDPADLPVELPEMPDFRPAASDDPDAPPRPPLGRAPESWRHVVVDGVRYERELNTMPQWAGSCWYYLRFLDPDNGERFVDREVEQYWMRPDGSAGSRPGVDLYVGGAEHAVLHLLYARFWHKVLHDLGHVSTPEPFGRLFNQGYIQAHAYRDERGMYVPAQEVEARDGQYFHAGRPVTRSLGKMGKSLKNAIGPDEVSEQYGCDTMRLYEMYMGPLDASKPWEPRDIIGMHRFLHRVWRNLAGDQPTTGAAPAASRIADAEPTADQLRVAHKGIRAVTESMEQLKFNTAIAALIDLNGAMLGWPAVPRAVAEAFVVMLSPLAPHMAEELWSKLGHARSLAHEPWPEHDESIAADPQIEIPVQVMGRVRGHVTVAADADAAAIEAAALADEKVRAHTAGKTIRRVVVVPGRLVNIVTG
jgi:leucyl-tRNA synthetase